MNVEPGAAPLPRALLFTDVVDSTALAERLGPERAADLWAAHDRKARDLLASHDGLEIGRGDGLLLVFDDAARAARYALAYQATMSSLGLSARVAIHVGPTVFRANPAQDIARGASAWEVDGPATPVASRLMALARGGQILMSGDATKALRAPVPEGARLANHGFYRLKGIEAPMAVDELGLDGVAPFTPPADVPKAYRVAWNGELWLPLAAIRHTLPVEHDAFVGRTRELCALAARFDASATLVTLRGPAGAGKTRLARRYAWTWLGEWPGGVYFCDLSEARSFDGVVSVVADALGIPLGGDDPVARLGHGIASRGRALLILDNFEQVIKHANVTVARWLDVAPQAAFLVTSREHLHLRGEAVLPLDPLPIEDDAIELFACRARAHDPSFSVSSGNRAAIADVVHLLDGLPLAIELAAARARLFSAAELRSRLSERFTVLRASHAAVPRQATLRAAIDWSWELLTTFERDALAQLSLFEGGFTVHAAEAVIDVGDAPERPSTLDLLESLIDKSLVRRVDKPPAHGDTEDSATFALFLSIQAYAAERLHAHPHRRGAAERRHWTYYARFGTAAAITSLSRPGGERRFRDLLRDRENMLAACRRAADGGDGAAAVAALAAAWVVLEMRGPFTSAREASARVIAMQGLHDAERIRALLTQAAVLRRCGTPAESSDAATTALALARKLADPRSAAAALLRIGALCTDRGDIDDARARVAEARAIADELGDLDLQGAAFNLLGIVNAEQGDLDSAGACFGSAWSLHERIGDRRSEAADIANLANVMRMQGDDEAAIAHFGRALQVERSVGDRRVEGLATGNLGSLYRRAGRRDEALRNLERALEIHREVGNRHGEGVILRELAGLHTELRAFDAARQRFREAARVLRDIGSESELAGLLDERDAMERRSLEC